MHASPLLDGFSFSPVTFWMTPSSIFRVRPQPTPQKPQIVATSRAPLTLPFSETFSVAVAMRLTPSQTEFPVALDSNFDGRDCLACQFPVQIERPVGSSALQKNQELPC